MVSIVATALLVAGPLRHVAKGYSKYLTSLFRIKKNAEIKTHAEIITRFSDV